MNYAWHEMKLNLEQRPWINYFENQKISHNFHHCILQKRTHIFWHISTEMQDVSPFLYWLPRADPDTLSLLRGGAWQVHGRVEGVFPGPVGWQCEIWISKLRTLSIDPRTGFNTQWLVNRNAVQWQCKANNSRFTFQLDS